MISSAELPSPFHSASNTFLAMLLEIVLSAMRWIRPASCAAAIGEASIGISDLLSRAASSPMIQLAMVLALAAPADATAVTK